MEQRTISRMTEKPIRLSALGRDVKVGDLYNYYNDLILQKNTIELLDEDIDTVPTFKDSLGHYLKPDDNFKRRKLGINSHFKHSIKKGNVTAANLWFNDYLQNSSTKEDDKNLVKIDFYFRLKRYTKRINEKHFNDSKWYDYQSFSGGRATHLVEEVVYGVECICSMRRDLNQSEIKENVEKSLQMVAKAYIHETINPNSISVKEQPKELTNVICTNYCSLSDKVKTQCSIQQFCEWLRENVSFDKDFAGVKKWQAVEIVLRNIPDQIGALVLLERINDFSLERKLNRAQFTCIHNESNKISKLPLIDSIPPFEKMMRQFLTLLSKFEKKLDQWDKTDFSSKPVPEKVLSEMGEISDLFDCMTEWLCKRRIEIEKMCSLLKDIQPRMFDLSENKALEPITNDEFAKVFLLKMDYVEDPLLARIKKFIGTQNPPLKLPVFPFLAVGQRRFSQIEDSLKSFNSEFSSHTNTPYLIGLVTSSSPFNDGDIQNLNIICQSKNLKQRENRSSLSNSSVSTSCEEKNFDSLHPNHQTKNIDEGIQKSIGPTERQQLIEEQCSSTTEDGSKTELTCHIQTETENPSVTPSFIEIGNINDAGKVPNEGSQLNTKMLAANLTEHSNQVEPCQVNSGGVLSVSSDSQNNIAAMTENNMYENRQRQSTKKSYSIADRIENGQLIKHEEQLDSNMPSKTQMERMQTNPSIVKSSSCQQDKNPAVLLQGQVPKKEIDCHTMDQGSIPNEQSIPEKKKIAEIFTQEEFANPIKDGHQPMVYQLNTKERSVGENLRYFEITGQSDIVSSLENSQNHKVIILMGATGSGKSTLINGMINYILGVQWKDPFRFKCVREDSSVVRNEAHSQTDSVTAYTLHHRQGMAIPYSITLIDTPGYGDTRGIKRDKEITGSIHRFLTQQQGFKIDQIHAIGFVAASGNIRLTPTHRYVLDSVLSIFGKDVKENIRLLVTFADNATPPVVEACRVAHFPMSSPSAGVMYNKFNSSVLYASNNNKGDSRIKEVIWNMGQRNYKTFFTMLENMNGRDLKSTRQVIENRQLLEQSLQDIEDELEVCFETIEKLDNQYLQKQNSDIKWKTNQDTRFELETAKTKVMSLLEQVSKSDRLLDSAALRSHSPGPVDYLSLMRSRVVDEKKTGFQVRLHILTELQNSFNENNVDEARKKMADFPLKSPISLEDKASVYGNHDCPRSSKRTPAFKQKDTNRVSHPPNEPCYQHTNGSLRSTKKRSEPEKKTNFFKSSREVRNRDTYPIRKSSNGETNTKKSQLAVLERYPDVNHKDIIQCENTTGGAEAESEDPAKHSACSNLNSGGLSTGSTQTYLEMGDDQNLSELENPLNSEKSLERSNEKKQRNFSEKLMNAAKTLLGFQ